MIILSLHTFSVAKMTKKCLREVQIQHLSYPPLQLGNTFPCGSVFQEIRVRYFQKSKKVLENYECLPKGLKKKLFYIYLIIFFLPTFSIKKVAKKNLREVEIHRSSHLSSISEIIFHRVQQVRTVDFQQKQRKKHSSIILIVFSLKTLYVAEVDKKLFRNSWSIISSSSVGKNCSSRKCFLSIFWIVFSLQTFPLLEESSSRSGNSFLRKWLPEDSKRTLPSPIQSIRYHYNHLPSKEEVFLTNASLRIFEEDT